MKFRIGDYIKHKEYPKSKVLLHLSEEMHVDIANTHADDFELCTKEEYDEYWEENNEYK